MNLNKKIAQWQSAGLITAESGKQILTLETSKNSSKLGFLLGALATFFISLGAIAFIATGWDLISPTIKLIADFAVLSTLAYFVYDSYSKNKFKLYDIFSFAFCLMILASIGLISQIYQLQSDSVLVFFIYTLLIFPLTCFNRSSLLASLWMPSFLSLFISYLQELDTIQKFLVYLADVWKIDFLNIDYFLTIFRIGSTFLLIIIYQILSITTPKALSALKKALKFWSIIAVISLFIILNFTDFNFWNKRFLFISLPAYYSSLIFLSILALISLGLGYLQGTKYFPALFMFLILANIIISHFIITIVALAGVGLYAYQSRKPRLLNLAIFLIGFRIFILYISQTFNLTSFGVDLISSGIILLLLTYGWRKVSAYYTRKLNNEK